MIVTKRSLSPWIAAIAAILGLAGIAHADLELPRVSPSARVDQTIATTDITVKYCRPGVKGRVIWGDLVPYDKVWRTGANEATTFKTSGNVTIAGQKLTAGDYALFTIPGRDEWTVVFNSQADQWGAFNYDSTKDVIRVKLKPTWTRNEEWMRFSFEDLTNKSGDLVLRWEKLSLAIPIEVDVTPILEQVKSAVAGAAKDDWRIPYRAASFCMDYDLNKADAAQWAEQSVKIKENYFNVSLLARFRADAGNLKQAIQLGEKAIELGKKSENPNEVLPTERLVAQWKEAR